MIIQNVRGILTNDEENTEIKEEVVNELSKMGVEFVNPQGAFYIFAKIPEDYIQTKDGTITSQDVVQGKIGYSKKERIVGNLVIQKYYTGSTTPSQSLGKNGDIYLQK